MRALISARYPMHGIYGEEFGSERVDAEFVWVLDPIDGTKSFITGKPLFGTLIACLHRGIPMIGIIDQCVLKERWVGARGCQTKLNGVPVQATGCSTLKEAMMYATTPHMFGVGHEADAYSAMCAAVKRPLYGADCYAYALVASGFGADLVVEIRDAPLIERIACLWQADLGLYDYCALVPVVEGAGGVMTDWDGFQLTLQHHEASRGRVVAAANTTLHREAVAGHIRYYTAGIKWLRIEGLAILTCSRAHARTACCEVEVSSFYNWARMRLGGALFLLRCGMVVLQHAYWIDFACFAPWGRATVSDLGQRSRGAMAAERPRHSP
eukprot:6380704-Prymnesium_polylepis.1